VGYRDNRDALQARADALQRDLDTAKARADQAEGQAEGAEKQLKKLQRERDKLVKRLNKKEGKSNPQVAVAAVAAGLLVLAGAVGFLFMMKGAEPQPEPAIELSGLAELEPATPPAVPSGPTAAELRGKKVVILMNALDRTDHIVHSLRYDYHGPKKPEFPQSFDMPSWHSGQDFEETYGLFADARLGPDMSSIDSAASDYVKHLRTFLPVLQKATRYYDHRDYRDDAFELGRELDPLLVAGWKEHTLRSRALREALAPETGVLFTDFEERTELDRRVDAAWKACSELGDAVLNEQPLEAQLTACNDRREELVSHMTSSGERSVEYFAGLLDDIVKNGKKIRRAANDFERRLALSSMAQVYSYASNKFRENWLARLERR
jgi:hypothetical protein